MSKKFFALACLMALAALSLQVQTVFAHETITMGDYEIVTAGSMSRPLQDN